MLKLRYILRLIGAFLSRFKVLMILCVGLGIVIFFLFKFLLPILSEGKTTRIGLTGRYTLSDLPSSILDKVGDGLTKLDAKGNVEPDLSSKWETPDKGKTWIFSLKDNLFWQDGKKVVSSDISYQFSDVTVGRPDAKTIIFKLQNPYSAFPSVVARPTFKSGLLGTGEYRVTNISLNGNVVEQLGMRNKAGDNILYKFYPTEEQAKLALELGWVDSVSDIFDSAPLDSWAKLKITEISNNGEYVAVFFNTQDNFLKDKNIRQALSYAIDKDALGGKRVISPISVDSWAYNPQVKPYDYDPVKAKTMIDDYKTSAKVTDISINLATTPILLNKAEIIATDWQAAGVKVNVQVITQPPTDYQAFLAIFDIPDDPDQYSMWHSTQTTTNLTHYQNPRIDKLLEDGRSEIDTEARKKIYLDFQRFLVEDAPAAFLYYPTTFTINRR
jgi:peptide/nickel transport system substrate-binding protein